MKYLSHLWILNFNYLSFYVFLFLRRGYEDNQGFDHLQPSYDTPYSSYPQQAQSAHNHNPHVPQTPGMAMNHLNTGRGPYDTTSTDYETNDYSRRGGGGGGGAGDYYQNPTTAYGGDYFKFPLFTQYNKLVNV